MNVEVSQFIDTLVSDPSALQFADVIDLIDRYYDFQETTFVNGEQHNDAGTNSGSCKVLSFALMNDLTKDHALHLFAQFYQDVTRTPEGDDHQNIRQFMVHGYQGLSFSGNALIPKL